MLYIQRIPKLDRMNLDLALEQTWHVGEVIEKENINEVTEVQADGHELEYIRLNFPGLCIPKKSVVLWFGDTAKFIVANL